MVSFAKRNDALRAEVAGRAEAVSQVDRVRDRIFAVRDKELKKLLSSDVAVWKWHSKVRDDSRNAVGRSLSRRTKLFKEDAVDMKAHVDWTGHTAMWESAIQIRALQHKLHSNLSKAIGISVSPILDDACEVSFFFAGVRPEDVCIAGSSAP